MNTKSFKLATLALITSFYVGNVVAEEVKSADPQVAEKIAEQVFATAGNKFNYTTVRIGS